MKRYTVSISFENDIEKRIDVYDHVTNSEYRSLKQFYINGSGMVVVCESDKLILQFDYNPM